MARSRLVTIWPMFPTADIARSAAFYQEKLGFTLLFQQGDEYARLQRDAVTVDLWKCTSPEMKGNEPGCRLVVDDIDALFDEFRRAIANDAVDGPRPTVTPLEVRPWGREFAVFDVDDNVLHVGALRVTPGQ